jgi:outer membrane protein TolC
LSYDYKIKNLEIERKLKLEMLKPQIDLQFNPLLQPTRQDLFLPYNVNNFKFGLQASFPIFIRKERGDLKLTNLKLKAAQLERNQKELEIQLKIQNIQNQISSLVRQLELQEKMVSQYLQLRDAEQLKFEIGESTLFLTNIRELKYLESKQKLIELKTLYVNTNAELIYQTANIDYAK